jgi:hypothetical protein
VPRRVALASETDARPSRMRLAAQESANRGQALRFPHVFRLLNQRVSNDLTGIERAHGATVATQSKDEDHIKGLHTRGVGCRGVDLLQLHLLAHRSSMRHR